MEIIKLWGILLAEVMFMRGHKTCGSIAFCVGVWFDYICDVTIVVRICMIERYATKYWIHRPTEYVDKCMINFALMLFFLFLSQHVIKLWACCHLTWVHHDCKLALSNWNCGVAVPWVNNILGSNDTQIFNWIKYLHIYTICVLLKICKIQ